MPRLARKKSATGIYHIVQRGINRQDLFYDDEDKRRYFSTLKRYVLECNIDLLGYCLMDSHVHLLVQEYNVPIGTFMQKIGSSYVFWYNDKYDRNGHLFQDRFKSEPVEDDKYLLTVLRYIHQNPLKANMVEKIADYPWSSYKNYILKEDMVSTVLILGIFNENIIIAKKKYVDFMGISCDDKCLDISTKIRMSDKKALKYLLEYAQVESVTDLNGKSITYKRDLYCYFINDLGGSVRQLARLTGHTRRVIMNIVNESAGKRPYGVIGEKYA